MKHIIEIESRFNITNKGTVLVTNLDYDEYHQSFSIGDEIEYDGIIYSIKSIEALLRKVENDVSKDFVAFFVNEIL